MKIQDRVAEIRRFCEANRNPALVEKYRKYFVEGYDAYGLGQDVMEPQRDLWLQQWGKLGLGGFLKLGDRLVETGKYEEGTFAIWFAAAFKDDFTPETLDKLGRWLDHGLRNWAHIDFLSGEVLSRFVTEQIVPLQAFSVWRRASSKWKRRAVPVTLVRAVKRDKVPVARLLAFIDPMMRDEEKVVRQGLGWFLREAWKKHPAPVEAFLLKWKDSCGRLIIQYATERMSPAEKARFAKSKGATPPTARGRRTA
jgi:3-methyladenine DNA glycosylase AlkD